VDNKYRRHVHRLNNGDELMNDGDRFDLASVGELPQRGITVEVKNVHDVPHGDTNIRVFRVEVVRERASYVDLYFTDTTPTWRNPDLWVDWAGDNDPPRDDPENHFVFPEGEPLHQGETVRYPEDGTELHWLVARVHNGGDVAAQNVEVRFYIAQPPGTGDKDFDFHDRATINEVPPQSWATVAVPWRVNAANHRHQCLRAEISDWQIPEDPENPGIFLASDDVWAANNWAQKNVSTFEQVAASPYETLHFEQSVYNGMSIPVEVFVQPSALGAGLRLTVDPVQFRLPALSRLIVRCRLEMDPEVIRPTSKDDTAFLLRTWRLTPHTAEPFGACLNIIRPRRRSTVSINGEMPLSDTLAVRGTLDPARTQRRVRLRVRQDDWLRWIEVDTQANGAFSFRGSLGEGLSNRALTVQAFFDGDDTLASTMSNLLTLQPPLPLF
jgi:hypothetical protein